MDAQDTPTALLAFAADGQRHSDDVSSAISGFLAQKADTAEALQQQGHASNDRMRALTLALGLLSTLLIFCIGWWLSRMVANGVHGIQRVLPTKSARPHR